MKQVTNKTTNKTNVSKKTQSLALTGVLTAVVIIMAFTPLGYLKTPGVEISFIMLPVVIGAILLGPRTGAILGGVFGLTSFIQCFGMSAFGSTLLGINPIFTFILCVVPRILAGWLPGLIFNALKKFDKTKFISFAIASLSGALLNTVLFVALLVLFFWQTDYIQSLGASTNNVFGFFIAFVGLNGLLEAITCLVLGTAITKPLSIAFKKMSK